MKKAVFSRCRRSMSGEANETKKAPVYKRGSSSAC